MGPAINQNMYKKAFGETDFRNFVQFTKFTNIIRLRKLVVLHLS